MLFVPVPNTNILMCLHETRRKDFAAYDSANPGNAARWDETKLLAPNGLPQIDADDDPVTHINWNQSQAFCAWLTKKEGKIYRLPMDREWSEAVGIGRAEEKAGPSASPESLIGSTPNVFPWGTGLPPPPGAGNLADESLAKSTVERLKGYENKIVAGYFDGFPTTAPVMSFEPNPLGLFDLEGNVCEFCEDLFGDVGHRRVIRGGAWSQSYYKSLWSCNRGPLEPDAISPSHGFRIVLMQ